MSETDTFYVLKGKAVLLCKPAEPTGAQRAAAEVIQVIPAWTANAHLQRALTKFPIGMVIPIQPSKCFQWGRAYPGAAPKRHYFHTYTKPAGVYG